MPQHRCCIKKLTLTAYYLVCMLMKGFEESFIMAYLHRESESKKFRIDCGIG